MCSKFVNTKRPKARLDLDFLAKLLITSNQEFEVRNFLEEARLKVADDDYEVQKFDAYVMAMADGCLWVSLKDD